MRGRSAQGWVVWVRRPDGAQARFPKASQLLNAPRDMGFTHHMSGSTTCRLSRALPGRVHRSRELLPRHALLRAGARLGVSITSRRRLRYKRRSPVFRCAGCIAACWRGAMGQGAQFDREWGVSCGMTRCVRHP